MKTKLTKAQTEVLKAYRDNTNHNRNISVVSWLFRKGYLEPNKDMSIVISEKGKQALKELENK